MMTIGTYLRLTTAALLLGALGSASACGSTEESSGGGTSGAAGSSGVSGGGASSGGASSGGGGGMDASVGPVECGGTQCQPLILPIPGAPPVGACCATGDVCGLDSTFLATFGPTFDEPCQPRDQPGVLDDSCADSANTPIPDAGLSISFKGCCRSEVGKCGYMLDKLFGTIDLGLGCVDSEPFLEGGTAAACQGAGGATSGSGGASSTGGAGGVANAGAGGS